MRRVSLFLAALLLLCLCACTRSPSPAATPTPSPSPSAAPPPTVAPPPTASPAPTPELPETPSPTPIPTDAVLDVELDGETVSCPAYTFTGDLNGDGRADFALLLPPEEVAADYEHNAWVFRSLSDPEKTSLEVSFVAGTDTEALLPGFMDGYLSFTEIEFSEAGALGTVRKYVGRVTASDGETFADAWLLDTEGGVLTAVLLRRAEPSPEADILAAMLDTFALRVES